MADFTYDDIAKMLDHSLLQPKLSDQELAAGCQLAAEYGVASVCIKPYWVRHASDLLAGSGVAVGTVVGFPQGGNTTAVKAFEAEQAILDGATELDMVVNIGKVLSEDWGYVGSEIGTIVRIAREHQAIVKVIFENSMIEDRHRIRLCELCTAVGAAFVKTATGYGDGGATDHDLRLMRQHCPAAVGVKAAGGIRTLDRLLEVRALGVSRVGATASKVILDEVKARLA
ncbi:MAG: deoxyribose-phosphate aldolase [Planctomycetota bacterium]